MYNIFQCKGGEGVLSVIPFTPVCPVSIPPYSVKLSLLLTLVLLNFSPRWRHAIRNLPVPFESPLAYP